MIHLQYPCAFTQVACTLCLRHTASVGFGILTKKKIRTLARTFTGSIHRMHCRSLALRNVDSQGTTCLMEGSTSKDVSPHMAESAAATSLKAANCCSFVAPTKDPRLGLVPIAENEAYAPPVESSPPSLSTVPRSTKPVAEKMALLRPKATVGGTEYIASTALAERVSTAKMRELLACDGASDGLWGSFAASSCAPYVGNWVSRGSMSLLEMRTTRSGRRAWRYLVCARANLPSYTHLGRPYSLLICGGSVAYPRKCQKPARKPAFVPPLRVCI